MTITRRSSLKNWRIKQPALHGREALRTCFLPYVPERIAHLHPVTWQQVTDAFETKSASENDVYLAGIQLLIDANLYRYGYYASKDDTVFGRIAALTKDRNEPPLRIAHCIRDLAYGDESRTDDLVAMVQSDDPAYRTIFEACYWRDPNQK